jgi:PAS domain S-box-containing protein
MKRVKPTYEELEQRVRDLERAARSEGASAAAFREAEAKLRESEEKFRLAFYTSPDSINFNRASDGVFIDVNQGFCALMGYSREEVLGKSSLDLNIWDDLADRDRLVGGLVATGYVENLEAGFRRKDGQVVIGLMSARLLQIENESVILSVTRDITERKRTAEQYQAIFENAVEGFFQSTPAGRFIRVNQALARKCGYDAPAEMVSAIDDIGGQHYARREDRERFGRLICEKGLVENFEHETRRRDGSTFWVSVSARAVRDAAGRILYYQGSHIDIDARKKAEMLLADAGEQYRSLFETSTNAILIRNRAGVITMANPAAAALLTAATTEELIGRTYLDCVHPEDRPLSAERVAAVFRMASGPQGPGDGSPKGIAPREHRMVTLKGDVRDVESTGVAFPYRGELFIQGIFRDISERKRAEEALRESEARFRTAFENASVGITLVSLDGVYLEVNPAMARMTGYHRADLIGRPVSRFTHPDDLVRRSRFVGDLKEGRIASGEQERRFIHRDGSVVWTLIWASVQRDPNGAPMYFISLVQDTTARKTADEEKRKLESQLLQAQKMEAIGSLAGGIAHDFNNILSAIMGFTELSMLSDGAPVDYLREVMKAAQRAKDLVQQILSFSRQTDEQRMPVHVGHAVQEIAKFLRASIPATIDIRCTIDERAGAVLANSVELHRILMNLCANAVHAIGERAGAVEIGVQAVEIGPENRNGFPDLERGPYVRLSVKDNGQGIPPGVRERMFDPYFTTKEKGVGTGLGLTVVHGIVKKSNGTLRVESERGKGSSFHVYLPKVELSASTPVEHPAIPRGGAERILFVDDEKMLVEVGERILRRLGYDVVSRTSPLEALELFKARPGDFDLVISDQTMPGLTGDALAGELMKLNPGIPVILCTGYSQLIDQRRVKEKGIRALVMKPILINDIANAIRTVLEEK